METISGRLQRLQTQVDMAKASARQGRHTIFFTGSRGQANAFLERYDIVDDPMITVLVVDDLPPVAPLRFVSFVSFDVPSSVDDDIALHELEAALNGRH